MTWISVKDRLPEDFCYRIARWDGKQWTEKVNKCCEYYLTNKITHCMPLPEGPNDEMDQRKRSIT